MATRWGEQINPDHDSKPINVVITGQSWQALLSILLILLILLID